MSAGKQPGTQIKLTNVSVVRLKKAGKRFEIACYKNTVRGWRSGAQTDLSEVIQIDNVFTNVSKGAVAPSDDLQKAFGTTDVEQVMMQILKKGELQVGEKERAVELEDLRREICTEVAQRCVDPGTKRPHTVGMIEKAMSEVGYNVQGNKAAKAQVRFVSSLPPSLSDWLRAQLTLLTHQALDLIKVLQAKGTLPIARAQMRVRITMASKEGKRLKDKVLPLVGTVEDEDWSDEWELHTRSRSSTRARSASSTSSSRRRSRAPRRSRPCRLLRASRTMAGSSERRESGGRGGGRRCE
ncbi:Shwachman-Bodian-diamond syndrome protein-domain-containing protein [Rhodotorula diobovata]|uniref:Shwachman-Bodian-diamond syndrome protein-domain-containing protein n=1 Tax=Rhodotorula diobovata TaxID=5288 RepID=A0A5C5G1C0_9BASI|nr:Shwachman-Bodian-diamond syndrome protein-domain-containing protein [Rhodotorula diobovata]